jgi:hypothetical protein
MVAVLSLSLSLYLLQAQIYLRRVIRNTEARYLPLPMVGDVLHRYLLQLQPYLREGFRSKEGLEKELLGPLVESCNHAC